MEDLTGKQLGPYQIRTPLGEGGMAAVYKAYQPSMDRYVALKVLPRHFASDPEFVGRFSQEARVIANLQHPHILPVHDFGESDGYTYLTMRFIEGGTLADWLKENGPMSFEKIRNIVTQVGGALDYAHAQGVIHRDIKPGNILVDRWDNCLLTDFGLAKMVESSSHLTQTGGILGTPAYMSPEQGLGKKIDSRSDIYSLGVVLYQMAIGRLPYQAETPMAVVIKHIHDPLPPPSQFNPDIPEALELVILKSLAKNSEDRFASAGEMVKTLQSATERPTVARTKAPSPPEPVVEATAVPSQPAVPSETAVVPPAIQPAIVPEPALEPKQKRPFFKRPRVRPLVYIGLGLAAIVIIAGIFLLSDGDSDDEAPFDVESINELLDIVDEGYENDDLDMAFKALGQAIDIDPGAADLHCQLGYLLRDMEAYEDAIGAFDECRRLAEEQQIPDIQTEAFGEMTMTEVRIAVMETDEMADAIAILDDALQNPQAPSWLICERGEHNAWYDNQAAIADFEICRAENEGDDYWPWRAESSIHMLSGYDALDNEDYYVAIEQFSAWAGLVPEIPWPHCGIGDAHFEMSEYQQAREAYQQCLERAGEDPDTQAVAQSGEAHAGAKLDLFDGNLDGATKNYNRAIEFNEENGALFCERGIVFQELDKRDEARADYERCLDILQDDPDGRAWAADLLQSLGSSDQ
ncbi:MAG: protein kinase [Chloroflexi bacterium]|nr:protein kinase [Chloroflexota bacterium]